MTDEQFAELTPWSEKLQSIKNRIWIIVNYSNSQRAGVFLNLTTVLLEVTFLLKKTEGILMSLIFKDMAVFEKSGIHSDG